MTKFGQQENTEHKVMDRVRRNRHSTDQLQDTGFSELLQEQIHSDVDEVHIVSPECNIEGFQISVPDGLDQGPVLVLQIVLLEELPSWRLSEPHLDWNQVLQDAPGEQEKRHHPSQEGKSGRSVFFFLRFRERASRGQEGQEKAMGSLDLTSCSAGNPCDNAGRHRKNTPRHLRNPHRRDVIDPRSNDR